MKITWEENDIKEGLRMALNTGASEEYMVGYIYLDGADKEYTLISLLDGQVNVYPHKKAVVVALNHSGTFIPKALAA